jgi:hypothetical protein
MRESGVYRRVCCSFRVAVAGVLLLLSMAPSVSASLINRGGGMIYDDVLNVTWLQDANYAKTSGYSATGLMNWTDANAWAQGLVYGGYSDWRLPTVGPVNGTAFNMSYPTVTGSTDDGWNITNPASEMSYLYYVTLGNKAGYCTQTTSAPCGPDTGLLNTGPFTNLHHGAYGYDYNPYSLYWSGTALDATNYFYFSFERTFITYSGPRQTASYIHYEGDQSAVGGTTFQMYAMAVRDGDVSVNPGPAPGGGGTTPVPEPATLLLVGPGLAAIRAAKTRVSRRK